MCSLIIDKLGGVTETQRREEQRRAEKRRAWKELLCSKILTRCSMPGDGSMLKLAITLLILSDSRAPES